MGSMLLARPGSRSLRKGRFSTKGQIYHVTTRAQADTKPFVAAESAFVVCAAFHATSRLVDATLLAWVLMPDHAHWLIELGEQHTLNVVVGKLKSAAAGAINRFHDSPTRTSVWQAGFYDRAIRRDEDVLTVARYVVANPLRAGLVTRLGDYPWWNSVWL